MLISSMMDTRTILLALVLLSTTAAKTTHVTPNSTAQVNTTDSTSTAPAASTNLPSAPSASQSPPTTDVTADAAVTTVSTQSTTPTTKPAPISCRVGSCSGSSGCLNDTTTVKVRACNSGEICELNLTGINATLSEYKFSCVTTCSAQKGKGEVACCSTSNCIPDINNNNGDTVTRYNFVAMVCLVLASVMAI